MHIAARRQVLKALEAIGDDFFTFSIVPLILDPFHQSRQEDTIVLIKTVSLVASPVHKESGSSPVSGGPPKRQKKRHQISSKFPIPAAVSLGDFSNPRHVPLKSAASVGRIPIGPDEGRVPCTAGCHFYRCHLPHQALELVTRRSIFADHALDHLAVRDPQATESD